MIKQAFKRLWHDERGNTLALAAAVTIPLLGLVGSGVDLSRTYLAKNKLQQACDAGVIGGRKVMTTAVDAAVIAEVRKFVNFNFPQGTLQTTAFAIDPVAGIQKSVVLTLATRVPTGVMKIFGISGLDISVSCTGRQDFINTDVMLVLDTTGSMNCLPGDGPTAQCGPQAGSKMEGLELAVAAFYTALKPAQNQLEAAGLRLRYGIVPYSSAVNVGKLLMATNTSWLNQSSYYRTTCTSRSSGVCTAAGAAVLVDHGVVSTSTPFWNNWAGCIEERQTVNSIDETSGYTPSSSAFDLALNTVPDSSAATKWNAWDPASQVAKNNGSSASAYNACPGAAQNLAAVANVGDMNTYTDNLDAVGGTYHDIGLIWGGRMLSQTGLWASNNPLVFNTFPVNRHLIFMTDGALAPNPDSYGAYGIERFDRRVTTGTLPSAGANAAAGTHMHNVHRQRFRMLCNAIKGMDISLWVIQFGVSAGATLDPEMVSCASTPTQAFRAGDSAQLNAQFTQIGESIGALRLSQ